MARVWTRDPLAGRSLLVVDGSNQRPRSAPGEAPEEADLVGRLRAVVPPAVRIVVVLDTDPPPGASTVRQVAGVTIRHARGGGGDDAIVGLARADPARTLVVTDDRGLRERIAALGARTAGNEWLERRRAQGRTLAPSVSRRRPPASSRSTAAHDAPKDTDADDQARWRPGRRATVKRGNPRRRPRRR